MKDHQLNSCEKLANNNNNNNNIRKDHLISARQPDQVIVDKKENLPK